MADWWPRRRWTDFTEHPFAIKSDAQKWRKS